MRQKTIVLIRNAQPYDFGGAERFPVFVAETLKKHGFDPVIISRHQKLRKFAQKQKVHTVTGWWWRRQSWNGWRTVLLPIYLVWQLVLFFYYLTVFLRLHPMAIHIQSKDDFIAATYAARIIGAKVIWTDHADLKHIWRNIKVWYKNPVGKLVYVASRFVDAITVISNSEYQEVVDQLPQKNFVEKVLHIVNNGSPDAMDTYPPAQSNVFTFCSTNRLVTDKGISEMLSAFKRFHDLYPESKLVLVGNGPEEERFRETASGEPSIVFAGYQSDPLAFVAASDVLLQPTYHEGFSISILEGFMLQKPVIATSVGGNVEMIKDGVNGLLVPAKDADALYRAMVRLYDNPGLRDQLAKNARALYLQKFVFEDIIKEKFIPLYEKNNH